MKNPCYCLCSWPHDHNRVIGPLLRCANKSNFVCSAMTPMIHVSDLVGWDNIPGVIQALLLSRLEIFLVLMGKWGSVQVGYFRIDHMPHHHHH